MANSLITKECENCHKIFIRLVQNGRSCRFCSPQCSREYQRGSRAPNWGRGPNSGSFIRTRYTWTPEKWNDGFVDSKGYFRVYHPDYPKTYTMGYAKRYHIVWWLKTGELLPEGYVLHHKNGDKLDDRFENLELLRHGLHSQQHNQSRIEAARITCCCRRCSKPFFLTRSRLNGGKYGRGKYCSQKCYHAGSHKQFHEMYERRICLWCKNTFVVKKSVLKHAPGRYCSARCSTRHTINLRWAIRKSGSRA